MTIQAKLLLALVLTAVGFGMGWTTNGWRLGRQIEQQVGQIRALNLTNATLEAANKRCGTDVQTVRAAVAQVVADAKKANDAAVAAMNRAAGKAAEHQAKADEILSRPPVAPDQWCATIRAEQAEHVQSRRAK